MDNLFIDAVGYLGLGINLISMALDGEKKLRVFSLVANSIYIIYGCFLVAFPIIIGSSIAVALHTLRLRKLSTRKKNYD
ncbi:hypothetical protein ED312_01595 [Sinomicrobium pectinilyticum]|uniref:Uncharacterized protein n=1 Tax=Sinomicrobium pectinilyticum TaxID=1084421 RepID=A0A3N0F304_SINP1|nr:hypothetical protein [Sinomicrobium pectinilyticum]RNL94538.1 hypothetical protein ED312_01595 [Sinomicrobium pectinilyticum]